MLEVDSNDYTNKSKSPIWKLLLPLCGNNRILEEFNHNNQGETTRKGKKKKHTHTHTHKEIALVRIKTAIQVFTTSFP